MTRYIFALSIFFITSTVSTTIWATTLKVSENLIVSHINNKAVEHGFISNSSEFSLEPGQHALTLHYKDVFEDFTIAEHRVVNSKDFVAIFNVDEQKSLTLRTPKIKNLAQADQFSRSPTLILLDENNQQLNIAFENVADYKISEQVEQAITTYTEQQAISHENLKNSMPQSAEPTVVKQANNSTLTDESHKKLHINQLIQIDALPMLKYWWQNASDTEKKLFKHYMAQEE